jgi:hypothetical protein
MAKRLTERREKNRNEEKKNLKEDERTKMLIELKPKSENCRHDAAKVMLSAVPCPSHFFK